MKKNISVIGAGYVGLSLASLLSLQHNVICFDKDSKKIDKINQRISPIEDNEIKKIFYQNNFNIRATINSYEALNDAEIIIIATPTDYDFETNKFDTSSIDESIKTILTINKNALILIKSTIPIGYTKLLRKKFQYHRVIFSPEFLREGKAVYDNLFPSRIVIGDKGEDGKVIKNLLLSIADKKNREIDCFLTQPSEAEAIKLFANTFLAMRVSYFNELDSFCEKLNLDTKDIILGVSSDNRIGNIYNNPSFGYGGYCLPKDTKHLLSEFGEIPNNIISAIVKSNSTRKDFITENIMKQNPKNVGIFRLAMKEGSDNYRESAILGIIERFIKLKVNIIIYEPMLETSSFLGCKIISDVDIFKSKSDIILSNRMDSILLDVKSKVYTRDIFNQN